MKPLVSVIVPTRNRGFLLPRAIKSVLNQEYGHLELIIVDDASVDSTPEIAGKYREKFENFKYIHNDRSYGGAKTRNIGIQSASGEYIAFLDDDDEWLPKKIESQLKFLSTRPDVMAVSSWYIKDMNGKRVKVEKPDELSFEDMLWDNFFGSFSFAMVRPEIFKKVGFLDESLPSSHDWEFWIRVSKTHKIGVVNEFLSVYHWHSENISRWTQSTLSSYAKVYERNKNFMNDDCIKYHKKKLVAHSLRLIKGTGKRIKNFIRLLNKYNLNLKTDFLFIFNGLFALCLEDFFIVKMIKGINKGFYKPHRIELEWLYKKIHKAG